MRTGVHAVLASVPNGAHGAGGRAAAVAPAGFRGARARSIRGLGADCRPDGPQNVQRVVEKIAENCEDALATVLFTGGAGGSLRAGVTDSPVELTRAIKRALVNVTCGGAPAYVWPGGGITIMVDVSRMPEKSFGTVPTPAVVAPIEFTMRRVDYTALGGHVESIRSLQDVLRQRETRLIAPNEANPWPLGGRALLG